MTASAPSIVLTRREIGRIPFVRAEASPWTGSRPPSTTARFDLGADLANGAHLAGFLFVETVTRPDNSGGLFVPELEVIVRSDATENASMPIVATFNMRGGEGHRLERELVKLRRYVSIACWPVRVCAGWTDVRAWIEHA